MAFRVDSGGEIGLGNTYRALSVAQTLVDFGLTMPDHTQFWLGYSAVAAPIIQSAGYRVVQLPTFTDAADERAAHARLVEQNRVDLVLVDVPEHPDRDAGFYQSLRSTHTKLLINLSDQNSGRAEADVVVQGDIYYRDDDGLLCQRPRQLLGARYMLLNPLFAHLAQTSTPQRHRDVLICFGGSDPASLAAQMVAMPGESLGDKTVTLVVGSGASSLDAPLHWDVYHSTTPAQMAQLMSQHKVGVISGGLMQYEAACMGLPCIVIAQNQGQFPASEAFHRAGIHTFMGGVEALEWGTVHDTLAALLGQTALRLERSSLARRTIDGRGCSRLVEVLRVELQCQND